MKNVLIPTKLDPIAKEILDAEGFTVVQDTATPLAELVAANPDVEGLIVRSEKVTAEVIDALPKLRLVVRAGAGYNTIDTKYARKKNVDVMNTPGANANAVAEEVVAMTLAYMRHIIKGDQTTREGLWEKKNLMGTELTGKTVGIVGLGNIGRLVARRMSGFEVKVLAYDPVLSDAKAEELGVRAVDLETIFKESDIVSLHIPENKETAGLINIEFFDLMKDGAILVNCARAGIINEDDLREARKTKCIAFLNDVYAADAPGEKSVKDIADIMLPHLGASTREANETAARRAATQMMAYAERGITTYVVNKSVPDGLDESYQELAYQIAVVAKHCFGDIKSVSRVECSFYGELKQFSNWLVPNLVAGICPDFDPLEGAAEAANSLSERGAALDVRNTDDSKKYGNSLTVDLFGDNGGKVSVRGTIAEGNLMISRINEFDKLYFPPVGHSLVAIYKDRPGVLAKITKACGDADVNIDDVRCPHNEVGDKSIAVLKVNKEIPRDVVQKLGDEIQAERAFYVNV